MGLWGCGRVESYFYFVVFLLRTSVVYVVWCEVWWGGIGWGLKWWGVGEEGSVKARNERDGHDLEYGIDIATASLATASCANGDVIHKNGDVIHITVYCYITTVYCYITTVYCYI